MTLRCICSFFRMYSLVEDGGCRWLLCVCCSFISAICLCVPACYLSTTGSIIQTMIKERGTEEPQALRASVLPSINIQGGPDLIPRLD